MKKFTSIIFTLAIALSACSGGGFEVSEEMGDFMSMFNGRASGVEEAVEKYVSPKLYGYDIADYNLENPVIVKQYGDCYTIDADYQSYTRTYDICWSEEGAQIVNIIFSGERDMGPEVESE